MTLQGRDTGLPWAIRGWFKVDSGLQFSVLWRDIDAARNQWVPGARCDLTLELSTQTKRGSTFFNWSVVSVQSSGGTVPNRRDELTAAGGFQPPAQPRNYKAGNG
jgi:hypothetical protein